MTPEVPTSCVFCRILDGELTPGVVAFRDSQTAVFPSRGQQPRNRGHKIVVPIRHVAHIYEVDDDLAGPMMTTLARSCKPWCRTMRASGAGQRNSSPLGARTKRSSALPAIATPISLSWVSMADLL